jgi:hypothetical protein
MIHEVPPGGEIVRRIVAKAQATLARLGRD